MMNDFRNSVAVFLALLTASCGDSSGNNDGMGKTKDPISQPLSIKGSAEMTISESWNAAENAAYSLESATKCTKDSSSGTMEASFTGNGHSLTVQLRNFTNAPKVYTCRQAANNQSSSTSVGDRFNGCGVKFAVDADDNYSTAEYSSYRDSTSIPPFAYPGECSVEVTEIALQLKASLVCISLVQTQFDGAPRNPIDSEALASVNAQLACEVMNR